MTELDATHDAQARSWVASANAADTDFPLPNLPVGVVRRRGTGEPWRGGIAIGEAVLDLALLAGARVLDSGAQQAVQACAQPHLNGLLELGPGAWHALRHGVFTALSDSAPATVRDRVASCLVAAAEVEHALPVRVGDYTDFYTSEAHAANIGRLFRPEAPLAPNFKWLPCGYHGRVSSLGVSGQEVRRPLGQWLPDGAGTPAFGPSTRLDYELEIGMIVGSGNPQGVPVPLSRAAGHIFGYCLLNDWSARDIQRWESQPLGPFLAKNFATTLSPWIVTAEALEPYRGPRPQAPGDPALLAYLDDGEDRSRGALDIRLEVWLETALARERGTPPERISATSFRHQHWTPGQMVAHHTIGGCNLQPGDLLGSGTVSGPAPQEAGALIERSEGGRKPLKLSHGEVRSFLADGDTVIFRGWCERPGYARIGFGDNRGTVQPALSPIEQQEIWK